MLNKLKFYEHAKYEAGHPLENTPMTGAEAYASYGKDSGPIFSRVGGSIIWRGNFEATVIGPTDEHWDQVFIARYPSAGAFLEMVTDPVYQQAVKHDRRPYSHRDYSGLESSSLGYLLNESISLT